MYDTSISKGSFMRIKPLCVFIHTQTMGEVGTVKHVLALQFFCWPFQCGASFVDPFCYLWFMFVFAMLSCLFLAGLWSPAGQMTDLLALLCIVFSFVFVTFPYGVSGQVWYLIVSIPDLCLPLYFYFIGYLHFLKTLKKWLNLNIKVVNMTRNATFTDHRPARSTNRKRRKNTVQTNEQERCWTPTAYSKIYKP